VYQRCTNRQKTVKTAKMTIDVPIVTCLPRLYQPCTNSVPKTVKRQSKQQKSPLVYQSSRLFRVRRIYKVSIRRIHKALISLGTDYAWCPLWAIIADFLEKSRETSLPDSGLRPPHHRAHYVRFRTVFFTAQRAYKYYKLRGTITLTIRALKLSADASPTIVADDHSVN